MSSMLYTLYIPIHKEQLEEHMENVREDPSLNPNIVEIESGGLDAIMK